MNCTDSTLQERDPNCLHMLVYFLRKPLLWHTNGPRQGEPHTLTPSTFFREAIGSTTVSTCTARDLIQLPSRAQSNHRQLNWSDSIDDPMALLTTINWFRQQFVENQLPRIALSTMTMRNGGISTKKSLSWQMWFTRTDSFILRAVWMLVVTL